MKDAVRVTSHPQAEQGVAARHMGTSQLNEPKKLQTTTGDVARGSPKLPRETPRERVAHFIRLGSQRGAFSSIWEWFYWCGGIARPGTDPDFCAVPATRSVRLRWLIRPRGPPGEKARASLAGRRASESGTAGHSRLDGATVYARHSKVKTPAPRSLLTSAENRFHSTYACEG
jgi:hypothetical protein